MPDRMSCCPFDGAVSGNEDERDAELRVSFQGGRIDALCHLVVDGIITLEEAMPYTGMVEEELVELYENWKLFNGGDVEGSDE